MFGVCVALPAARGQVMVRRLWFAVVFVLAVRPVCGPADGLELKLAATRPITTAREPVDVRVSIDNLDSTYWVLYAQIFPAPLGVDVVPRSCLTFEILDEAGRTVRYVGDNKTLDRLKEASLRDFLVLGPRFHYGLTVSLDRGPWAHALGQPGRYRVKARLSALSRTWIAGRIEAGRLKQTDLAASFERFVDGTLESNEIEISIRP